MQFLCSPALGALSDRFGRRPVILIANFGLGLDYVFMALAPTLGWLFVGRVISGITGASFPTANAYIADVTPPEKRAASFGLVGAAWGLGFVLGPALGGLLGEVEPRLPFWVAAGLTLVNACYGLFVLPESLPRPARRPFTWRRANPVGALGLLQAHPGLMGLAGVNFLYLLAHQVLPSVFVLYTGYRFEWGPRTVGLTLAVVGLCLIVVQAGLVRPLVARLGERRTLLTGLITGSLAYAAYGLAPRQELLWSAIPVLAFMGLFQPSVQSLMSRRVSVFEQGRLQGANASLMGMAGLVGPGMFTLSFAAFIDPGRGWDVPGAPFLLASLLMVLGAFLAARMTRTSPPDPSAPPAGTPASRPAAPPH